MASNKRRASIFNGHGDAVVAVNGETVSRPLSDANHPTLRVPDDDPTLGQHRRTHSMETVYICDSPSLSATRKSADRPSPASGLAQAAATAPQPYDPHDYCDIDHPTSFGETVQLLFLVSVGPLVLCVPVTFARVGYVLGFATTVAALALYAYSMRTLAACAYHICQTQRVPRTSYADTVYHAFCAGPKTIRSLAPVGRYTVLYLSKVVWFGSGHYSFVLVSHYVRLTCETVFDFEPDADLLQPLLVLPLAALFCVPDLEYLVPFATVANAATLLTVVFVVYYALLVDPSPWTPAPMFGHLSSLPSFVGVLLLAIKAAGILLPLKNRMKRPANFDGRRGVLMTVYAAATPLYALFALLCSLKFGRSLRLDATDALPEYWALGRLGTLLMAVAFAFQYPLIMYVPFDVIWNEALKEWRVGLRGERYWEYAVRVALVLLSYALSVAVPNAALFVALSGTVASSFDSFVLPAVVQTLIAWGDGERGPTFLRMLAKNALIVGVAVVLMGCGLADCVVEIVTRYGDREIR